VKARNLILASLLLFGGVAAQAETPFQFAAPNLRAPSDPEVNGIRFSVLHGDNARMSGVDFGLLSMSETHHMSGVGFIGGVHRVHGNMDGGVVFSLVNLHSGYDSGLNHAFINLLEHPNRALNIAFINLSGGHSMIELGGINVSGSSGAQIGFVNVTERIKTFQFGFLNVAENGFLPIFPVFNFAVK